jgi:hypothetical protein
MESAILRKFSEATKKNCFLYSTKTFLLFEFPLPITYTIYVPVL